MAQTIASLVIDISVKFKEVTNGINKVNKDIKGLGKNFQGLSNAAKVAWAAFGAAALVGIKKASKAAIDFETDLAKLSVVSGKSISELSNVGKEAQRLGARFGVSSNEVVKAITTFGKLGYSTSQSLKAIPDVLKYSIATFTDLDTAVKTSEAIMTDFGKKVQDLPHIFDILTATTKNSLAKAKDLKDSFKKAGPAASKAKASISDVAAATGILAKASFTGSEAGQALNRIFSSLSGSSKKVQKAFKEIGVSQTDQFGKTKDFKILIDDISKSFANLTEKQKLNFANTVAGTEHQAKFLNIIGKTPGEFKKFTEEIEKNSGITETFFSKIDKTAGQSLNRLSSSFNNFSQNLGTAFAPSIQMVADKITDLLEWFNNLDEDTQKLIGDIILFTGTFVALGGIIAVLGPAISGLIAVYGLLNAAVITFTGVTIAQNIQLALAEGLAIIYSVGAGIAAAATWLWNAAVWALGIAFAILTSPITLIIIAIGLLVAAIIYFWNTNEDFRNFIINCWENIKNFFKRIPAFFKSIWENVKTKTKNGWEGIKNAIHSIWENIKNFFTDAISNAGEWGINLVKSIGSGIKKGIKYVTGAVKSVGSKIKSYLGFASPTDIGPLSTSDKWMPNLMNMLTHGIEMGIPKLQMAVGDVVSTIDVLGNQQAGNSMTVNVYPRQANLDPRGLTRELQRTSWLNGGAF